MDKDAINFDELIKQLDDAKKVGRGELAIWGGSFEASKLQEFLDAWGLEKRKMPYRVWEWASAMVFEKDTLPDQTEDPMKALEWLERGRAFGPDGDLSLRRDGERFFWHFVGEGKTIIPENFGNVDYWASRQNKLTEMPRKTLLWGEYQERNGTSFWQEDRVSGGAAPLDYPVENITEKQRLVLNYNEYLLGDNVEAVWWLEVQNATL